MKMCVCDLAFAVTICVSIAVVDRTTEGFCSWNLAISGMILFSLHSFYFSGATTVIFSVIAIVRVGLRKRFLLVVGMSFHLPLLWLR